MDFDMNVVNTTIEKLKERQFDACFANTREEAFEMVKSFLEPGCKVANGGSVTLSQIGVMDLLKNGDYNYLAPTPDMTDREKKDITRQRFFADVFLMSSNAITTDGRIVNEDGASTRVAPMIYGPDKVVIVAGVNKIVPNMAAANARIKYVAAINCKRIGFDTPCTIDGKCHDCRHDKRSCCTNVTLEFSRIPNRITVILVGEELGV